MKKYLSAIKTTRGNIYNFLSHFYDNATAYITVVMTKLGKD